MSDFVKLGVDIGTATIKIVELAPQGKNHWKLISAVSSVSPVGGVVNNQGNLGAVSQLIVKMMKDAGMKSRRVIASIPEDQVSSHIVEMPLMSDGEIQQALQWQVEQYIPIPAEKAVWSYQVIKKDEVSGGMEVMLVAAAKSLVNSYTQILETAGLEVIALETELVAAARSLVPAEYPLSLIVDIGARSTDLGVVKNGQLVFSRMIPTAGEAFTRAIETGLGLDTRQAEEYKNTYGFLEEKLEGKLAAVMKPVLIVIAGEIKKTIDFYTSKHSGEAVKVVILSGGVATVPDMVNLISGMIGIEVVVANPFVRVALDSGQAKNLAGSGPFYGVAIGLAMREA
jgi:type IV pilus assembly protein PilM